MNTTSTDTVIVAAARTPFAKFGGPLKNTSSTVLATTAMKAVVARGGIDPELVDEVYYGFTIPGEYANEGPIPARVAMLKAGLPDSTRSLTLDRACCSSLTAVQLADRAIRLGEAQFVLAGGCDNFGRAGFIVPPETRWGNRRGPVTLKDPLYAPGGDIGDPVAVDADRSAKAWGVTREAQDEWALRSQQLFEQARALGYHDEQIIEMVVDDGVAGSTLSADYGPRPGTTLEALSGLRVVEGTHTITAGNAPGLDAGASALILTRRDVAEQHGLEVIATVRATHSIARNPRELALAPGMAIRGLLDKAGTQLASVDLIEINEAFAAVPLVAAKLMADNDSDLEASILARTNINGGAIAVGHPPGASGARLVMTAGLELKRRGGGTAVAAICGGLGQSDAVLISHEAA